MWPGMPPGGHGRVDALYERLVGSQGFHHADSIACRIRHRTAKCLYSAAALKRRSRNINWAQWRDRGHEANTLGCLGDAPYVCLCYVCAHATS